jgi:hypothetical protein
VESGAVCGDEREADESEVCLTCARHVLYGGVRCLTEVVGRQDELLWAAAWLYKASMDPAYLQYVQNNSNLSYTVNEFSWDNKNAATQVLLSKVCMRLFEYWLN